MRLPDSKSSAVFAQVLIESSRPGPLRYQGVALRLPPRALEEPIPPKAIARAGRRTTEFLDPRWLTAGLITVVGFSLELLLLLK
jgi:hypothetical protein